MSALGMDQNQGWHNWDLNNVKMGLQTLGPDVANLKFWAVFRSRVLIHLKKEIEFGHLQIQWCSGPSFGSGQSGESQNQTGLGPLWKAEKHELNFLEV